MVFKAVGFDGALGAEVTTGAAALSLPTESACESHVAPENALLSANLSAL